MHQVSFVLFELYLKYTLTYFNIYIQVHLKHLQYFKYN